MISKHLFYLILIGLVIFSSCDRAEEETSSPQAQSDSGNSSYSIDDTSFEFTNFWNQFYSYDGVDYIIHFKNSGRISRDDSKTKSVYDIQVLGPDKDEMWYANITAHEITIERDVLIARFDGGDEFEDTYEFYNLTSGEKLISFTNSRMTVSIPNSPDKRFIGVLSRNSNKIELDKGKLGIFTFASNEKVIDVLEIEALNSEIESKVTEFTPDMNFVLTDSSNKVTEGGRGLILWNADKDYSAEMVGGFKIKLYFFTDDNDMLEVIIPVENDRIEHSGMEYDKDYFKIRKR